MMQMATEEDSDPKVQNDHHERSMKQVDDQESLEKIIICSNNDLEEPLLSHQ